MEITITDSEIISILENARKDAVDFQIQRSENRLKWLKAYRQDPYGNETDGWSKAISSAIWDAVEGLKPNLVERFTGDWFKIKADDQDRAELNQKLLRHQLYQHNKFERTLDQDFIYQVLNTEFGILKVYYAEEWREKKQSIPRMSLREAEELQQNDNVEIKKATPVEEFIGDYWSGYEDITLIVKERFFKGFKIECVPGSEFYISSDAKDVDTARFVEHRVPKTLDYIAKMEKKGVFRKGSTDLVADKLTTETEESGEVSAEESDREIDGGADDLMGVDTTNDLTRANAPVIIFESYYRLDVSKTGFLEPVVLTTCSGVVLAVQENNYLRPPFFLCAGFPQAHRIDGTCLGAILENEQKDQTNLRRLMIDGVAESTYATPVTDDPLLVNVLKKRTHKSVVKAPPGKIDWIQKPPPNQLVFKAMEHGQNAIEEKTPYSRMAQGSTDAGNALNKTASGMNMVLTSAARKERLLARRIARTMEDVIRFCLWINEKISPPHDFDKIIGQEKQLKIEDLLKDSEYELEVIVGLGPQDKIEAAQILDQYISFGVQAGLQLGICTPSQIATAIKRKHKLLDVPIESMMNEPTEIEQSGKQGDQQKEQALQQMQEQMQQASQQIQGLSQEVQKKEAENQKLQIDKELDKTKNDLKVNNLNEIHRLELQNERDKTKRAAATN